jgi:hypothetical protein
MATRFIRKPRQLRQKHNYTEVIYESHCGMFRYTTDIIPNSWSTWTEKLEMTVPEPVLRNRQYANPPVCESIFTFNVGGMGSMRLWYDLRQGKYLQPLVPEFWLDRSREHEWKHCWTREDPKTFFNRGDYDEIWKAMMLLKVSIDRTDPELKMRNRWWSRQNVSTTLFRRHLSNGDRKPYTP